MERDGVVEEELRGVFEILRECIGREILKERVRGVGKQKGNVVGQGFWEDGGENGEGIVGTDCNARNGPIDKNKNGADGVDVILDLRLNTLFVELVLLKVASIS